MAAGRALLLASSPDTEWYSLNPGHTRHTHRSAVVICKLLNNSWWPIVITQIDDVWMHLWINAYVASSAHCTKQQSLCFMDLLSIVTVSVDRLRCHGSHCYGRPTAQGRNAWTKAMPEPSSEVRPGAQVLAVLEAQCGLGAGSGHGCWACTAVGFISGHGVVFPQSGTHEAHTPISSCDL